MWLPVRVKETRQNKKLETPFRFNRNGGSRGSVAVSFTTVVSCRSRLAFILNPIRVGASEIQISEQIVAGSRIRRRLLCND